MSLFSRLFRLRREAPPAAHVALHSGRVFTQVGPPAILHGLFSTIAHALEPAGWGSRFPHVMNGLYAGRLEAAQAAEALAELRTIERELSAVPAAHVVWDIDRPSDPPSPHYTLGAAATTAADFFVTVTGRNLLRDAVIDSVESAVEFGDAVAIVPFDGTPR
jgi:2,3-bisphosphoglycerate-dependent phosphoglycerate mutase